MKLTLALTLALFAVSTGFSQPKYRIVENIQPDSNRIALQAIIGLPALGPSEAARVEVIARALLKGTEDYTEHQLLNYLSLIGIAPSVDIATDHIRIQISVPKGQSYLGVSMLDSMLRRPILDVDRIDIAIREAQLSKDSTWSAALFPEKPDFSRMRRDDVLESYRRYFRPDNLIIGIGGAINAEEFRKLASDRWADWNGGPLGYLRKDYGNSKIGFRHSRPVASIEIGNNLGCKTKAEIAQVMLGLTGLYGGKQGTLFREVREREALSYRQVAMLWPTPSGFLARVIILCSPSDDLFAKAEKVREVCKQAVNNWADVDRDRSLRMAKLAFQNGIGPHPLTFGSSDRIGIGLEDQTYCVAYWQYKLGEPMTLNDWLSEMQKVDLATMKRVTLGWLTDAKTTFILASN